MANKHSHHLRNTIIGSVVAGLILAVITPSVRGFLAKVASWAWAGIIWVWTLLSSDYQVPGWVILIIGLYGLLRLFFLFFSIYVSRSQKEPTPLYWGYTEDMLYGAKWRWSWADGKISSLWCFCPSCDAQLVPGHDLEKTYFFCENCPPTKKKHIPFQPHGRLVSTIEGVGEDSTVGKIKREIERKIRTGERPRK